MNTKKLICRIPVIIFTLLAMNANAGPAPETVEWFTKELNELDTAFYQRGEVAKIDSKRKIGLGSAYGVTRKVADVDADAEAFFTAFSTNTTVRELEIDPDEIEKLGGAAFENALARNTTIQKLVIGAEDYSRAFTTGVKNGLMSNKTINFFVTPPSRTILEAVGESDSIKTLHILKARGTFASAVEELLRKNKSISTLKILDQGLTSEGIKQIADALAENTSVVDFELGYLPKWRRNPLGDAAAESMAKVVINNKTLKKLRLPGQGFDEAGWRKIGQAFIENFTIDSIMLSGNDLGDALNDFADAIATNKKVLTLYVNDVANFPNHAIKTLTGPNGVRNISFQASKDFPPMSKENFSSLLEGLSSGSKIQTLFLTGQKLDEEANAMLKQTIADNNLKIRMK